MNLEERLKENLIAPLTFEDGEIAKFINRHVCACGSHLLQYPAPGRKWYAKCPKHGAMTKDAYISAHKAEQADQGQRAGMIELRVPAAHKTAMKDLGF